MKPGKRNLITDVAGLKVGNAQDDALKSGATVLLGDKPFTAAVHVMGGAPGSRETDLLAPDKLVQEVDALVLSGGSAFGLDAASGVADGLAKMGRGFQVGPARVPIVPGAILFDLLNGGDKNWGENPYKAMGLTALDDAAEQFELGSIGAGCGATTQDLKGGLGSASLVLENGLTVGALVAANPLGSTIQGGQKHFWAASYEFEGEFGGYGPTQEFEPGTEPNPFAGPLEGANTTIAIIATDAALTQAQATRLATAAHDGMARAIFPSHTPYDGDLIFAAATAEKPLGDPMLDPLLLGHAAAICLSRAIARAVYCARKSKNDALPTWHERFG
ncbi:MAG: L-aminopeptidase/D-esterase-like protein [Paracoccaceae bacterium]|jgi:L-aminopeptidase/D-esterase-like protein